MPFHDVEIPMSLLYLRKIKSNPHVNCAPGLCDSILSFSLLMENALSKYHKNP